MTNINDLKYGDVIKPGKSFQIVLKVSNILTLIDVSFITPNGIKSTGHYKSDTKFEVITNVSNVLKGGL